MTMKIRYGLFMGFLLVSAMQDLRQKQVMRWVFILFGTTALFLDGYFGLSSFHDLSWKNYLGSCFLGVALLGIGKICNGKLDQEMACFPN